MTVISESSVQDFIVKEFSNLFTDNHRAQWNISGSNPLRRCDDIRHHIPVIHRKPFAGAAPSAHHFVGNQQNPIFVTDLAHPRPVIVRWDDESVRSSYAFEEDRGNLVGT